MATLKVGAVPLELSPLGDDDPVCDSDEDDSLSSLDELDSIVNSAALSANFRSIFRCDCLEFHLFRFLFAPDR